MGVSSWRQRTNNSIPPAVKATASYMNSILAKLEAKEHGYVEAIMLNEAGLVCEGTGENLFVVRDGILSTPPLSDGLLEGITRDTVLCLADDLEIPAIEESLTRSDLYIADEVLSLIHILLRLPRLRRLSTRRHSISTTASAIRMLLTTMLPPCISCWAGGRPAWRAMARRLTAPR